MRLDVAIPALLADSIGEACVRVEAETVAQAVEQLIAHPKLGPLIFDESRALRRHVLLFYNDTSTRHLDSLDISLKAGDTLTVVQAVSGG